VMVKDDSLYVIAIVAVVAVVGLVVMATSNTGVQDLPSMVDSDSTAIAGQAISSKNNLRGTVSNRGGKGVGILSGDDAHDYIQQRVEPDLTGMTDRDEDGFNPYDCGSLDCG